MGYDSNKVAIELTELSPNLQNNRISVDKSYEGFIKNIDMQIPDYTHYLVVFHHANIALNKKLRKEIKDFLNHPNPEMEKCINGVFVRIKPLSITEKPGKLSQVSSNMNSCSRDIATISKSLMDANIEISFNLIIKAAIEAKKKKCENVEKPVWLAMHDSYFSYIFSESNDECIELYKKIMDTIDFGIFEKMIIIFKDREVLVFD